MGHVAYSPKNRLFEPFSGRFTPIRATNHRRERNGLPTLATVLPTPHDRRGGARRRCPAPIWVQHSPPGRRSTCYEMLRFPAFSKVWRAMFSSQVNVLY